MKVILLTASVLVLAGLLLAGCATGSNIVTGTTRPSTSPMAIKIYTEPPADYEVIGQVTAGSSSGWTSQGSMDYAVAELKKQAARLGANGVLLTGTTATQSFWDGYNHSVVGKAIFVNREK